MATHDYSSRRAAQIAGRGSEIIKVRNQVNERSRRYYDIYGPEARKIVQKHFLQGHLFKDEEKHPNEDSRDQKPYESGEYEVFESLNSQSSKINNTFSCASSYNELSFVTTTTSYISSSAASFHCSVCQKYGQENCVFANNKI